MNEMPRTPANHSAVAEAGLVEGQPPFRSIWWVNAWATVIAVGFYRLSSMATSARMGTSSPWMRTLVAPPAIVAPRVPPAW